MQRPSLQAFLQARDEEKRRAYRNLLREQEAKARAYLDTVHRGFPLATRKERLGG